MARPKSKGAYVPLAAQYFMDDAILEAGVEAELLFVRVLSFCASVPTDGFITERQVRTIVGLGLRNLQRRLKTLIEVGLIAPADGGYVVRSWAKWNRSADEIGRMLAKDRERKSGTKLHSDDSELHTNDSGLHNDYSGQHIDARGDDGSGSDDPHDSGADEHNSARNPDGIQVDSTLQSRAVQSSTEHYSPNGESSSDADAPDVAEFSAEVRALCDLLAELVRANDHKVGTVGKSWWQSCDRLMRLDGYTAEQVEWVMRWATQVNTFWPANIRSMPTLREKFSTLKAQALADHAKAKKSSTVEHGRSVDAMLAEREAEQLAVSA